MDHPIPRRLRAPCGSMEERRLSAFHHRQGRFRPTPSRVGFHAAPEVAMTMTAPNVVRTMCPVNGHPTFCGMLVEMEAAGRRLWAATRTIRTVKVFCVRGRATSEILGNPRRLLCPQIRDDRYTNTWRRVSWDEALDIVRRLRKVGPEAVGRWAGHGSFTPGSAVTVAIMQRFAKYGRMSDWQPA